MTRYNNNKFIHASRIHADLFIYVGRNAAVHSM